MWLSALLFGSVVDFMAEQLKSQVADGMNSQPVTQQLSYQGEAVQFSHQLWRIDPASVCADKIADPHALSRCQQAARGLFRQQCEALSRQQASGENSPEGSQRAMYCAAAHDYVPTTPAQRQSIARATQANVATVSGAQGDVAEANSPAEQLAGLQRQCRRLTVLAWISKEPARQAERDKACAQYDEAKSQQPRLGSVPRPK